VGPPSASMNRQPPQTDGFGRRNLIGLAGAVGELLPDPITSPPRVISNQQEFLTGRTGTSRGRLLTAAPPSPDPPLTQ